MNTVIADAQVAAQRVESTGGGRGFDRAVSHFTEHLQMIATQNVSTLALADQDALRTLADLVIDRIEGRLSAHLDRPAIERDLAGAIYRIRQLLEDIDRWQRHYRPAAAPASGRAS